MNIIVLSLIVLGVLGCLASVVLFLVARKFNVEEDPRIDLVEEALPSANCGGCGFAGCRNFAEACVNADSLDNLNCPVGGTSTMTKVGEILGLTANATDPMVAVVRCNGSHKNCQRTNTYDGAKSCAIANSLYIGETDCSFGCLGFGDCVTACLFDAIHINPETGLPEVDEDKCTACGTCVKACPKGIIELRKKDQKTDASS